MSNSERILVVPSDMDQIPLWDVDEDGQPDGSFAAYVLAEADDSAAYIIIDGLPRESVTTSLADDGVARVEFGLSAERLSQLADYLVDASNRLNL